MPKPASLATRFSNLSLARRFAIAGGAVLLLATLLVGLWVSARIKEVVVRNTANATALYMESFIAPLTQELATQEFLSGETHLRISHLLTETALGQRVATFKIWLPNGLVADATDETIVGQSFPITDNLRMALEGHVRADFDDVGDEEDAGEKALGLPLLEIYSPIREVGTGRIIAVAEFYEIATQLRSDLWRALLTSWAAVAAVMAVIGGGLFLIVLQGSRTIDRQFEELREMSEGNLALRLRVQGAAARFAAVNEAGLRRIGADLHDGPAQLMAFASLRLDALRRLLTTDAAREDLDQITRALRDAIRDMRAISRGLSLPDIDRKPMAGLIRNLAETHGARTGSVVTLQTEDVDLPVAVKICLYRVVQEGLTNGWRHGGGLEQEVRLERHGTRVRVAVLDRGPGIGAGRSESSEDGLGLSGLTDRVESLGGHLTLANRTDGPGAVLEAVIDLRGV